MKLKELNIEYQIYGENVGKYIASIEYQDDKGKVKMLLSPQISESLLAFIGPTLTKFSHEAALEIEKNLISSLTEVGKQKALSV